MRDREAEKLLVPQGANMIIEVKPDSLHYDQVIELSNSNIQTLGFLPYEAIKQAASEGRIYGFKQDKEIRGYALFGKRVRKGYISLTHLCVNQEHRKQGVARALIKCIVDRNPNWAGIYLSCRKDYEIDSLWLKLGFQRLGERPGRSMAGHLLVTWWLPMAARSLFDKTEQIDARIRVAIDTNILLDILEERPFPDSRALTADWVSEVVELLVTNQSRSELSKECLKDTKFEARLDEFRIIGSVQEAKFYEGHSVLNEQLTSNLSDKDLRIVAQSVSGSADYLVSRDQDLLSHEESIDELTGLKLLSPENFLLMLHSSGGEHNHQTRAIVATGMSISPLSQLPSNRDLSDYCHQYISERPKDLKRSLSKVTAHKSGRIEEMTTSSGVSLALGAMYLEGADATVTALRGVSGKLSYEAVRQMIHHLRTIVASGGTATIVVDDQTSSRVARSLRDEGFRPEGATWKAVVRVEHFVPDDTLPPELDQFKWKDLDAHIIRDYERYAWPSRVFSGTIPSYIVPIKPEFARVILGYEDYQSRLFELNVQAAIARENVYYMSPRPSIKTPARIMWWISGGGKLGGMAAISWLDEVDTADPRNLYRKYRNRGVLDKQQVVGYANRKGTALLFSQTQVFEQTVPITLAKELCEEMNRPGYFITTRELDESIVRKFYEEGMG